MKLPARKKIDLDLVIETLFVAIAFLFIIQLTVVLGVLVVSSFTGSIGG